MKITAAFPSHVSAVASIAVNGIRAGDVYDESSGMILNDEFPPRRFYLSVGAEKYRVWSKRVRDPQLISRLEHTYHKISLILEAIWQERRQLLQELKLLFVDNALPHIDFHAVLPNGGYRTYSVDRISLASASYYVGGGEVEEPQNVEFGARMFELDCRRERWQRRLSPFAVTFLRVAERALYTRQGNSQLSVGQLASVHVNGREYLFQTVSAGGGRLEWELVWEPPDVYFEVYLGVPDEEISAGQRTGS